MTETAAQALLAAIAALVIILVLWPTITHPAPDWVR